MPLPSASRARLLGFLPALLLAFGLVYPVTAFGQIRRSVNPQALADSFAYRIATFTPTSGPPGTVVAVHWQSLPALTPVRLGVGARVLVRTDAGWRVRYLHRSRGMMESSSPQP